ncbi:hypothetical protein Q9R19_07780 [Microbacterium sp. ARD32]|uniref:hypothetical protein n=1 Tax=Microbacterium sp. ARD32 TaxID=2962577 RepID=UPI002882846F|nr:hypothetical protein [Microbacterium sp. ARD32]MDT0157517.1 hypothetical protein [Microbacterium sp. ARD32]
MSLMERVREVGTEQAHIEESTVAGARGALMREIARSKPALRARRRMPRWAGLGIGGVVAGAAAVTAIVLGSVVAPVPAAVPTASAAVAQVMNHAAEVTIHASDTTLLPGQYLRIERKTDQLVTDSQNAGDKPTENAFRKVVTDVFYVPADRSDDWYVDTRAPVEITKEWGKDAEKFRRSIFSDAPVRDEQLIRLRMKGQHLVENGYVAYSAEEFAAMPRDPEELIRWFRVNENAQPGYESLSILNAVYLGLPPADLRAALFRALALVPGWEVAHEDGSRATLTRFFDVPGGGRSWQSFVIDTEAGMIVEVADSPWGVVGNLIPADEPGDLQSFSTSVVDSLP